DVSGADVIGRANEEFSRGSCTGNRAGKSSHTPRASRNHGRAASVPGSISVDIVTDKTLPAPVADRRPQDRTHHGDTFADPYEWLREKADAAVLAHLEAENAYTEQRTAHLASLRETIFQEIKGRTLETDLSVPSRRGQWWYYGRTVEGSQYGIQCRAPLASPDDWTPPS